MPASAVRCRCAKSMSNVRMNASSSRRLLALNDDNPVFAEQAIAAGVIDKTRDEELLLLPPAEIAFDRGGIVELRQTRPRMRAAGSHDEGKCKIGRDVGRCGG